jgi:S-methylmethionine-dependent homocysteine/selenocysteine methylase
MTDFNIAKKLEELTTLETEEIEVLKSAHQTIQDNQKLVQHELEILKYLDSKIAQAYNIVAHIRTEISSKVSGSFSPQQIQQYSKEKLQVLNTQVIPIINEIKKYCESLEKAKSTQNSISYHLLKNYSFLVNSTKHVAQILVELDDKAQIHQKG